MMDPGINVQQHRVGIGVFACMLARRFFCEFTGVIILEDSFVSETSFNLSQLLLILSGLETNPGPTVKKTHDENRKRICAVCLSESGLKSKAWRGVTDKVEALIKQFVCSDYSRCEANFPAGICKNCDLILTDYAKNKENCRPLSVSDSYVIIVPRSTRSRSDRNCQCRMCHVAR